MYHNYIIAIIFTILGSNVVAVNAASNFEAYRKVRKAATRFENGEHETYSPDGKKVARIVGDTLKVFDTENSQLYLSILIDKKNDGKIFMFSPSSQELIVSNEVNNGIDLFEINEKRLLYSSSLDGHRKDFPIQACAVTNNSNLLLTVCTHDKSINIWNIHTGTDRLKNRFIVPSIGWGFKTLAISDDDKYVAVANSPLSSRIYILDLETGETVNALNLMHSGENIKTTIATLMFHPNDSSKLSARCYDAMPNRRHRPNPRVITWDLNTGEVVTIQPDAPVSEK